MTTISAVSWRERTFYATHEAAHAEPHSSLTQLVQGIWQAEPAQARAILRRRIRTTDRLGPLNWGMVKTSAQRVARVDALEVEAGWQRMAFRPCYEPPPVPRACPPMELASVLAGLSTRHERLRASDRPVGCVLVGPDGALLGWAHNTNAANRTLHAEVNLIQWWWAQHGAPLPDGATLFTTLEPCRMCQGMIAECGPRVAVRWRDPDRVRPVPFTLDSRRFEG